MTIGISRAYLECQYTLSPSCHYFPIRAHFQVQQRMVYRRILRFIELTFLLKKATARLNFKIELSIGLSIGL